jgi:trimethylamine--corrinoid protein Co-methyltransferase
MQTLVQVLSAEECNRIHEETLQLLQATGVRVDTRQGRDFLEQAGAIVDHDSHIVRFPVSLVEDSLKHAPKEFTLGGRRPEFALAMNTGQCGVVMDGAAIYTYDANNGARRAVCLDDWYLATRLGDCLDEIAVYWSAIEGCWGHAPGDIVNYWTTIFSNFSKHVQEATATRREPMDAGGTGSGIRQPG